MSTHSRRKQALAQLLLLVEHCFKRIPSSRHSRRCWPPACTADDHEHEGLRASYMFHGSLRMILKWLPTQLQHLVTSGRMPVTCMLLFTTAAGSRTPPKSKATLI